MSVMAVLKKRKAWVIGGAIIAAVYVLSYIIWRQTHVEIEDDYAVTVYDENRKLIDGPLMIFFSPLAGVEPILTGREVEMVDVKARRVVRRRARR
jgi:hypothetical protein